MAVISLHCHLCHWLYRIYQFSITRRFITDCCHVPATYSKRENKSGSRNCNSCARLSAHGYNNDTDGIVKMTMIFTPGSNRERFFRKIYQMLDETPDDLEAFQKLYSEYDSYPLNERDMVPMRER